MMTQKVLLLIHEFRTVTQTDPHQLKMNPRDVTELARDRFPDGQLATWKDRNPVPLDEISRGHRFGGCVLDSIPAVAEGVIQIDYQTYRL